MIQLIISIGVVLLMLGFAVVGLAALRWLVPETDKLIPQTWRTYLSLQFGIYYLVAGLAFVVIPG